MPNPLRVTERHARQLTANILFAADEPPVLQPSLRDRLRDLIAADPTLAGAVPGALEIVRGAPSVVVIWAAPRPHRTPAAAQAARAACFAALIAACPAAGLRAAQERSYVRVWEARP